jgi:3-hydroxybutyryl-CoA dehydrogenase
MAFNKILIVGAGVMGQGLAEAAAGTGTEVILLDRTLKNAHKGILGVGERIDQEIKKWGKTQAEKRAILSRISPSADLQDAKKADLIIEAIPDIMRQKRELFQKLDDLCPDDVVFITNTATLSISELAAATDRPDKLIGMHFLHPVPAIPIVEIIRGLKTSEETFKTAREFADLLGKTAISVFEYPGYVTTRVIVPLINEAMHVVMEGICSARDVDRAMKLGFGFNVGPLALADMMGLDVVMSWMENLLKELSEHKYNPCPLLRKMVRAGYLGVKSGEGFFKYDEEGNRLGESDIVKKGHV